MLVAMSSHRLLRDRNRFRSHSKSATLPEKSAYSAVTAVIVATLLGAALIGCGREEGTAQRQSGAAQAAQPASDERPYPRHLSAPSLDGGTKWLNTAKPLTLADLRGKFVLLDFWTYCCINCMHVLPEIQKLEHAYPNELVVIGVHSAKFENEQDTQNIREAVLRYEIEHPVVNDGNLAIWNRYGVRSWPTLVLIDPLGDIVWVGRGEQTLDQLRAPIELGLPYYREHGLLKASPSPVVLESAKEPDTPLRFPGKVLADPAGNRLFVADSNHNRIVVADLDGRLQYVIGSGVVGRADGAFEECTFNHPQGMALVGDVLWVADTQNHLLRKVDLSARQVTTAAGTGQQGATRSGAEPTSQPTATALGSPWAVWAHDRALYIAMAGPHQIWSMSLDGREIGPYAGNGREDIVDGPLLPPDPFELGYASFAQPSGLASDGMRLYVADSEGSAVRAVPFDPSGQVKTLVGPTGNLFDFGDRDAVGRDVRLQHPLGVVFHGDKLYVADTYNNKIKVVDVNRRSCRTLAGTGRPGLDDAAEGRGATFNEPAGLSAAGGKLYVADTNNHAIRVVELADPYRVTTLRIEGLKPPGTTSPAAK